MNLPKIIRIVVADGHSIFREALVLVLDNQADMAVVGECADGPQAVALVSTLTPDLTILDLELPSANGVAVITSILDKRPVARILFLTTFDADGEIYAAMRAGACGYLSKGCKKGELLEAIREISSGGSYFRR